MSREEIGYYLKCAITTDEAATIHFTKLRNSRCRASRPFVTNFSKVLFTKSVDNPATQIAFQPGYIYRMRTRECNGSVHQIVDSPKEFQDYSPRVYKAKVLGEVQDMSTLHQARESLERKRIDTNYRVALRASTRAHRSESNGAVKDKMRSGMAAAAAEWKAGIVAQRAERRKMKQELQQNTEDVRRIVTMIQNH